MRKFIQTTFALLFMFSLAKAQHNISTTAGNGTAGYSGDGGAATAAKINSPEGVLFDASGNYYIADYSNHRIRMVNTSGTITTFAGTGTAGSTGDGGPATAAQLNFPIGLAIDGSGNIYIGDHTNNKVRMVNTSGVITTIAGTGTSGYTGDGGPATAATFRGPCGVAVDASNNVYVADQFNEVIRKISNTGTISTIAGIGGQTGFTGDNGPAVSAELNGPYGVTVDQYGDLFIADQNNNRIRVVSSGLITTIIGNGTAGYSGDGGSATAAELQGPTQVAIGPGGNLAISDTYNNVIRKVSINTGTIYTVGGNNVAGFSGDGGPSTAAEMHFPYSVAFNAHGDVYVADYSNNRVRELTNIDVLGLDEVSNNSTLSIYPNPASDNLNIVLGASKASTVITIYSIMGQQMYNATVKNSSIASVPVAALKEGIYIVKVATADGKIMTRKVEIAR